MRHPQSKVVGLPWSGTARPVKGMYLLRAVIINLSLVAKKIKIKNRLANKAKNV